jgi:hypothetical protein
MKIIDINKRDYNYSSDEINTTIGRLLKNDFEYFAPDDTKLNEGNKIYVIADLIADISNIEILNKILDFLIEGQALMLSETDLSKLSNVFQAKNYSEIEKVKISSLYSSNLMTYQLLEKQYLDLYRNNNFPALFLEVQDYVVSTNIDEIEINIKRKIINHSINYAEELTIEQKNTIIKEKIQSLSRLDYLNDTNFFKKDIEYLETEKNNITNGNFISGFIEKKKNSDFTIKKIALLLAYSEVPVTKENANEIIKKYDKTSGAKLYQEYNKLNTSIKRITDPDQSIKILKNKIQLFEDVIKIIDDKFKEKAIDELKILKSHLSKY